MTRISYLLAESNPATRHTQRNTDNEPDEEQGQHGAEGNGTTRALSPNKQVQQEEHAENEAGNQQRSHDDVALPSLASKGLVDTRRHVSTNGTKDGRNHENSSGQETTVGGGEKTKECEY